MSTNRKLFVCNLCLVFLMQALSVQIASAQERITLSGDDISRLGIIFETVSDSSQGSGAKIPAMVINSPNSISNVTTLYSGVLKDWLVNLGEEVQAGDVLALITSEELLDIENQWSATLNLKEQLSDELTKDTSLFEQGIISQQRLRNTQRSFQQEDFSLRALEEKLVRAGLSSKQVEELRMGDIDLGVYYLRAPESGLISHRNASLGEFVDEKSVLAALQTNSRIWIEAEVPKRLSGALQIGQNLNVEETGEALRLELVDLEIDRATQTIGIQAEFSNPSSLLPGQLVSLLIPPLEQGILISSNGVVHSGNETSVFVRVDGGVEVRNLSLIPSGANYLAQSGLNIGDEIVIQGTAVLKGMLLGLGGE